MRKNEFNNKTITIIEADIGKYLALNGRNNSEDLIGKPTRIVFDNSGNVPQLEERDL